MFLRAGFKVMLVLGLAAILVASCTKPYHSGSERYVFISANVNLPYWQEAKAGWLGAAHEMGVKAEFEGPSTYNPGEELKTFDSAVASHPSGILISPAQPGLFTDAINNAIKEGIPVICVDSDAPQSNRILFIGTDNYDAGLTSGKLIAGLLQGHGHIVLLTIPGQFNLEERLRGVEDALKAYPYISFAKVYNDNGDSADANAEISQILGSHADVQGILCLEASGGPGAAEAVDHYGEDGRVSILAMDGNPQTLDWITKNVISATVVQKPYTMGFYGLRFLDDLQHNALHEFKTWQDAPASPLPSRVNTGTSVINATNVHEYRNSLAVPK
ncbi:MAG: substrate-binding domain-containing protein [Acidobacteriota bacterium]|nr:substrate-binding domain-containing protein [Acidobacteriota bacterium]